MTRNVKIIIGLVVVGLAGGGGCGINRDSSSTTQSSEQCIILANGGNKLCGADAEAWCDSTDAIRDSAGDALNDPTYGDPSAAAANADSQAMCDELRGQ